MSKSTEILAFELASLRAAALYDYSYVLAGKENPESEELAEYAEELIEYAEEAETSLTSYKAAADAYVAGGGTLSPEDVSYLQLMKADLDEILKERPTEKLD